MSSAGPSFSCGPIRDMSCLPLEICQTDNELFTKHSFGAWGQQSIESPCAMGRRPISATTLNIYLGGLDLLQWPSSKSR